MRRVRIWRPGSRTILAIAALAVAAACSDQAPTSSSGPIAPMAQLSRPAPTVFTFGRVTDPAGDALPYAEVPPDLVSATIRVAGGNLEFAVRFAPGAFDPNRSSITLNLDTDQNRATGAPGVDAAGADAAIMGTDYILDLGGAYYAGQALLMKYTGGLFSAVDTCPVVFVQDGMDVGFPLSAIGSDDGLLNFKVTGQFQITDVGFTGVLDYMPNVGLAAGSTTALSEVTADVRFHPRGGQVSTTRSVSGIGNVRMKFSSVQQACLTFEFSDDLLDPGDDFAITVDGKDWGGFGNPGVVSQATRTLCHDAGYDPESVVDFVDGKAKLTFTMQSGSVTLGSVALKVAGVPR